MSEFPSVAWFEELRALVNADPGFRKFGTIDADMGVDVDGRIFKIVFDAFEVTSVAELDSTEDADFDFVLTMSGEKWREMLENIKANGHADLHYTLNTLDLEDPDNFARSDDYHRRDKFYRFNQTLQDYFDASAKMDTTFA